MIKCVNCGNDNQDYAKFCRTCGKPMPVTRAGSAPSPTTPPASLPAPQRLPSRLPGMFTTNVSSSRPPAPVPARSTSLTSRPLTSRPLTRRIATTINPSTTFRGKVIDDPAERRDLPRRDPTKALIWFGIGLVVVPPLLFFLFTVGIFLCVIAALGAGALLTCLALPLGLGMSMFSMFRPPQRVEVPYLEFRVEEPSGNVVNVEMVGQRRGGRITRNDEIEIDGEWADASQTTMRAYAITVLSAGGHPGAVINADRPMPRKAGTITFIVCAVIAFVFYVLPLCAMIVLPVIATMFSR